MSAHRRSQGNFLIHYLHTEYRCIKEIHAVFNNYAIHKSQRTLVVLSPPRGIVNFYLVFISSHSY